MSGEINGGAERAARNASRHGQSRTGIVIVARPMVGLFATAVALTLGFLFRRRADKIAQSIHD